MYIEWPVFSSQVLKIIKSQLSCFVMHHVASLLIQNVSNCVGSCAPNPEFGSWAPIFVAAPYYIAIQSSKMAAKRDSRATSSKELVCSKKTLFAFLSKVAFINIKSKEC